MKQTRYRRVSKDLVIATERTINEPAQSKLVNTAIALFLVSAICGALYYVSKLF